VFNAPQREVLLPRALAAADQALRRRKNGDVYGDKAAVILQCNAGQNQRPGVFLLPKMLNSSLWQAM
jgi:hypothetical protein